MAYLLCHIMQTTRASDADEGTTAPPYAPGLRLPLLGHALSYKADPPGFLQRARAEVGPIFTLDLAGLRTTVVSDAPSMRAVATAPERVLSAREAVSDFGFRYTLGDENVMHGTDFHKRILKEGIYGSRDDDAIADELSFVLDGIRAAFPPGGNHATAATRADHARVAFHAVAHGSAAVSPRRTLSLRRRSVVRLANRAVPLLLSWTTSSRFRIRWRRPRRKG